MRMKRSWKTCRSLGSKSLLKQKQVIQIRIIQLSRMITKKRSLMLKMMILILVCKMDLNKERKPEKNRILILEDHLSVYL